MYRSPRAIWRTGIVVALLGAMTGEALAMSSGAASGSVPPPTPTAQVRSGRAVHWPVAGVVLYDQSDHAAGVQTSSQDFKPNANWDQFDDQLADDFVVPAGATWTITGVNVAGGYSGGSSGSGPADWVNVWFYKNTNQLPSVQIFAATHLTPTSGLASGSFSLTLSPAETLMAGHYWVSVQASLDYPTHGQWRWTDRSVKSNDPAAWQNPLDGFGTGCTTWKDRHGTPKCMLDPADPDQIFQLVGSTPPPTITSFSPGTGPVGTSVKIKGTSFTGATAVTFNGVSATFTVDSDTQITATVPIGATTGTIQVTTPSGTATSANPFTVTPQITSFTPGKGPVGTAVTITGTTFTGATAVKFNGTPATSFTVDSDTQITATVPSGATTGPIRVVTPNGTAVSTKDFKVTPFIASLTPPSGPVGTPVTIAGTSFTGATAVTFHGVSAVFTVDSDSQISTTVPVGATTGAVKVTTAAGSSNGVTFMVTGAGMPASTGGSGSPRRI